MSDLVAFLRARLHEDEAAALASDAPSPWKAAVHESDTWIVTDATGEPLIYDEGTPNLAEAAHIARHDPARVLREVEAKRAILAEIESELADDPTVVMPQDRLRILAAVYRDHPDYDPKWAGEVME